MRGSEQILFVKRQHFANYCEMHFFFQIKKCCACKSVINICCIHSSIRDWTSIIYLLYTFYHSGLNTSIISFSRDFWKRTLLKIFCWNFCDDLHSSKRWNFADNKNFVSKIISKNHSLPTFKKQNELQSVISKFKKI